VLSRSDSLCEPASRLNLLRLFGAELDQFSSRQEQLDPLSSIVLHATHITVAGLCLAADLVALEHHAEQILVLRREITSATAVLNLVAPLAWET
jgi:hypothetical protein